MKLLPVERRSALSREEFSEQYLKPRIPVILTDLANDWEAMKTWNSEFFKTQYGHIPVPVFSQNYSKPGKGYMSADGQMPFGEFLNTIEQGPTDLRLFLFNIFDHAPELRAGYRIPDIMDGFSRRFAFMFWGAASSEVTMHYDIDHSNVFLTQFHGSKHVVLFPPEQSRYIYQQPYTVKSMVSVAHPDYERFPALQLAQGYECDLQHGETLFMPSRFWHYMQYTDTSFSLALRSNNSVLTKAQGYAEIAQHFFIDKGMNYVMGKQWHEWKERVAIRRAEELLGV